MDTSDMEAMASRRARLPDEPIYCAAPERPEDVLCYGSDHELDDDAQAAKRARYEQQARRHLKGQKPLLFSASLKGPFDRASGWKSPWLPKEPKSIQQTATHSAKPSHRPAIKESFTRVTKRRQLNPETSASAAKSTEPFCHLPSPVSNRDLQQLSSHDHLDNDKLTRIRSWAESVPSNSPVLDKDQFWAPTPVSALTDSNKRRLSGSEWLKTDLKRMKPSTTEPKEAPTPAQSVASTGFNRAASTPTTMNNNNPRRQVAAVKYASFGMTKNSARANAHQIRPDPFKLMESKDSASAAQSSNSFNARDSINNASNVTRPNNRLATSHALPSSQKDAARPLPLRSSVVKDSSAKLVSSRSPLRQMSPGRIISVDGNRKDLAPRKSDQNPNQIAVSQTQEDTPSIQKPNTPFSERRDEPITVAFDASQPERAHTDHTAPKPTNKLNISATPQTTRLRATEKTAKTNGSPVARRTRSRRPQSKHVAEEATSSSQPKPSSSHNLSVSAQHLPQTQAPHDHLETEGTDMDCSSSLSSLSSSVAEEKSGREDSGPEADAMSVVSSSSLRSASSISDLSTEPEKSRDNDYGMETMNESMILGANVDQREVAMDESMVLGTTEDQCETVMEESLVLGVAGTWGDGKECEEETTQAQDVGETTYMRSPSKSDGGGAERQLLFESVQHPPINANPSEGTGCAGSLTLPAHEPACATDTVEPIKVSTMTSEHSQEDSDTPHNLGENSELAGTRQETSEQQTSPPEHSEVQQATTSATTQVPTIMTEVDPSNISNIQAPHSSPDQQAKVQFPYSDAPHSMSPHSSPALRSGDNLATPQARERERTPEAGFTIRSFAEFNTPSPKRQVSRPRLQRSSNGMLRGILVVGGSSGSRSRVSSGRRVSFAPLPDNKDDEVERTPCIVPRATSPPPQTTRADWNEGMDALSWDDNMGRFFPPGGFDPKKLRSVRDGLPFDSQSAGATAEPGDIEMTQQETQEPDNEGEGMDVVDDVLGNIDDFLGGVWDVDAEAEKTRLEAAEQGRALAGNGFHDSSMANFSLSAFGM